MPENDTEHCMREIFGSDLCPSEEASNAPESRVPSPCVTNETSTRHCVYSKEDRDDGEENIRYMNEVFGSGVATSEEASSAPESNVPSPCVTDETSTRHRVYSEEDRDDEEEYMPCLDDVFGSGVATSEEASYAPEPNVPSPCATYETLPQRHVYSKETLLALRHDRELALPKSITRPLDGSTCEIPALNPNEPIAFSKLSLPEELMDSLSSLYLTTATAIQSTAIPYARLGADLVAQATSGTGKTLTYALVALDAILPSSPKRSAFVIVPTRELAYQVASLFTRLAAVRVITLVGGTKESLDEENLSMPVNVLVGTPGRVEVMIRRGVVDVSSIKVLVLDEADRLLDGSFGGSVERICSMIPNRQTLAFSATFSYAFRVSLMGVMREPKWIGGSKVIHSVVQRKVKCRYLQHKIAVLKGMLQPINTSLCLVFFNAKKAAGRLVRTLSQSLPVATRLVHAGITQKERDAVIREVRQGQVRVLVTTDVLARGIDFDSCDMVVHMDVPQEAETYLHRVGRAGRFGRKGSSTLLFDEAEASAVQVLEADIGYEIKSPTPPDSENVFMPLKSRSDGTNFVSNRGVPVIKPSGKDSGRDRAKSLDKLAETKVETPQKESHSTSPPLHVREDAVDAGPTDNMDIESVATPTRAAKTLLANSPQKSVKPSPQIDVKRVSRKQFNDRSIASPEEAVPKNVTEYMPSTHRSKKTPQAPLPPKRSRLLEEPATPAKKRKSARALMNAHLETREAPIVDSPRNQSPSYLNAVTSRNTPSRVEDVGSTDKDGFAATTVQVDSDTAGVHVLNGQSQNCDENMPDLHLGRVPVDSSQSTFTEKCRKEWDRYAAAAYDAAYQEAYEEAFQMAAKLRRRLLQGEH